MGASVARGIFCAQAIFSFALFLDQQADAFFPIVPAHRSGIGDAIHHGCHILHAHHGARRRNGHHHIFDLLNGGELARELHGELGSLGTHGARWHLTTGAYDGVGYVCERDPVQQEFRLVHFHLHFALFATEQRDLRHALQLLQTRQQFILHALVEPWCGLIAQRAHAHGVA